MVTLVATVAWSLAADRWPWAVYALTTVTAGLIIRRRWPARRATGLRPADRLRLATIEQWFEDANMAPIPEVLRDHRGRLNIEHHPNSTTIHLQVGRAARHRHEDGVTVIDTPSKLAAAYELLKVQIGPECCFVETHPGTGGLCTMVVVWDADGWRSERTLTHVIGRDGKPATVSVWPTARDEAPCWSPGLDGWAAPEWAQSVPMRPEQLAEWVKTDRGWSHRPEVPAEIPPPPPPPAIDDWDDLDDADDDTPTTADDMAEIEHWPSWDDSTTSEPDESTPMSYLHLIKP
jgi:hypothetical protein